MALEPILPLSLFVPLHHQAAAQGYTRAAHLGLVLLIPKLQPRHSHSFQTPNSTMRALFRRASIIVSPSGNGASSSDAPADAQTSSSSSSASRYAQPEDVSYAEAAAKRGISHSASDEGGIGGMPAVEASPAASTPSGSRNTASQATLRERSKKKAEATKEVSETRGIMRRRSSRLSGEYAA